MNENEFKTTTLEKLQNPLNEKGKRKLSKLLLSISITTITFIVVIGITIGIFIARYGAM